MVVRGSPAEWPSGLGKGLQSPVRGFDSRLRIVDAGRERVSLHDVGRLAQRESTSLTRKGSQVQSLQRPLLVGTNNVEILADKDVVRPVDADVVDLVLAAAQLHDTVDNSARVRD